MANLFDILNFTGEFAASDPEITEANITPRSQARALALSDDARENAQAMLKLIKIAKALGDRFGYDPKLVLEDMFRDIRLINGEEVLSVLDPNNPIDALTSSMYRDYKVVETIADFFGINFKNVMLQKVLEADPEECCDQFQEFLDAGHQIEWNGNAPQLGMREAKSSGFWTWMLRECLNEAYIEYDPKDGWTEEDVALHKSIDWKARNWEEYDTGESISGPVYIYRWNEDTQKLPRVVFHKFLRSNPAYSPYYRPIEDVALNVVGPMYDGRKHGNYRIHDRFEDQKTYNILSECLNENIPADLVKAYRSSNQSYSQELNYYDTFYRQLTGRKSSKVDFKNSTYDELSKEEAARRLKDRDNVESLRLLVNGKLITFEDKGGYGDGKYYRALYQPYYIENLPYDLGYENKNGNRVYDSRKIPVKHLVDIATKIYDAHEVPISDEIEQRRKNTEFRSGEEDVWYFPTKDRRVDSGHQGFYDVMDTGSHDWTRMLSNFGYSIKDLYTQYKRRKKTLDGLIKRPQAFGYESTDSEEYKNDLARYRKNYEEAKRAFDDFMSTFKQSYLASASDIRAKAYKLSIIKQELRNTRDSLNRLKKEGGSLSTYPEYQQVLNTIRDLEKRKQECKDKLSLASSGKEKLQQEIDNIDTQLRSARNLLADNTEEAENVSSTLVRRINDLNNAIKSYNEAVSRAKEVSDKLIALELRTKEAEDEADYIEIENETEEYIKEYKEFEKKIEELEDKQRALRSKTKSIAKEISFDEPDFDLFRKPSEKSSEEEESGSIEEELVQETYTEEEIEKLKGKVFNQQKIIDIYRRSKYGTPQLFAHTRCTECGKEKRVLLSNLVNDPDKYGSCKCSKENETGRARKIVKIYRGKETLPTNTSGYTGVYRLRYYNGKPYNKWRAVIEVDGKKHFLGDFDTKKEAISARKKAAKDGIKWYKEHSPYFKEL